MKTPKLKFGLITLSSLALILTACPSGTDTGGTTPVTPPVVSKYSKLGSIGLSGSGEFRSMGGGFLKSPSGFAQPASSTGLAEDTCTVIKSPTPVLPPSVSDVLANIVGLNAGAELSVTKGTETLVTLKPLKEPATPTIKVYSSDVGAVIPDVSGATLEIPGAIDGFPAMTVTLPNEIPEFTFEPTKGVTKDSQFTWTAPTANAIVTISAISAVFDTAGAVSSSVYVYCAAKDDGNFSFPASTKAEMDAKGFTTSVSAFASKGISKFVTKDDALLIVTASRSATFIP